MKGPARLVVNGDIREYAVEDLPVTLGDLVKSLDLDPVRVVAELNGELIKRGDIGGQALADGDKVEIVRLVGGG